MSHRSVSSGRRLRGTLLAVAASTLLALGGVSPAFAVFTPAGTATATVINPTVEGGQGSGSGYCPSGTSSVTVTTLPFGVDISALNYDGTDLNPILEGRFEWVWETDPTDLGPGLPVQFTATCLDAGAGVLATAVVIGTTFDSGATLSVPSEVADGGDVTASGTCPFPSDYVLVSAYSMPGLLVSITQVEPPLVSGDWSYTFSSAPANPGDQIEVQAECNDAETNLLSWRNALVDVLAAVSGEPTPPGPADSTPTDTTSELAETGVGPVPLLGLTLGTLAIVLGVGVVLLPLRRRLMRTR